MTATRDSDRTIRAWLDLMPVEAPDRAIADVLEAIDATPQARPLRWWPSWRTPMNRSIAALAAAVVIVVVGVGLLLRPSSSSPVASAPTAAPVASAPAASAPTATADPSTAPAASAAAVAIPTELIGRWMGANNAYVSPGAGSSMVFVSDGLSMSQSNANSNILMHASAGLVGGNLELTTDGNNIGCPAGDVGTYSWTRSTSGRILTIVAIQDACATRQAAVAGTWWKSACRDPGTDCLGVLDPGTYNSQYIRPMLGPGESWSPKFGGVTYTVPDGWANHTDWPSVFGLSTTDDFAATTAAKLDPDNAIAVDADPVAESTATPCSGKPDPKVAATVPAIVASLRHIPGLVVGPSTSLTLDGHPATSVDLSVDSSKVRPCGSDRVVEFLVSGGNGLGLFEGQRDRLILVDLGAGHVVAVEMYVNQGSAFDAFLAKATPIVQTLHFQ